MPSGVATILAFSASCPSGLEINRENHQIKTSDSSRNGMLLPKVTSARWLRFASVVSVDFCTTMPQPVDLTGA